MPVIDSHGIFDGDRINSCSVMAQLYYPRMLCASNGFGRIQLSYRKILADAFPRWPQEAILPEYELMGYFKEYADKKLIFLYESNGQIWGQWDAKKSTFGKYQTTEDKRSPSPPEEEFKKWQESNRKHSSKPSVAMVHFELSNPSAQFPQGSENLPQGSEQVGNGIGVGVGVGKRYEVSGEGKKPSARGARSAPHGSQVSKSLAENKHQRIAGMIIAAWNEHNPGATCPFGEADGKQLKLLLEKTTGWPDTNYSQCLQNLYATEGFPRSELPMHFLPRLPSYFSGPKDRYNRELGNGGSTSRAQEKLNRNREAIVSGLTSQGSWTNAGHNGADVPRNRTDSGSGVVLEGSPQRTKSATNSG